MCSVNMEGVSKNSFDEHSPFESAFCDTGLGLLVKTCSEDNNQDSRIVIACSRELPVPAVTVTSHRF